MGSQLLASAQPFQVLDITEQEEDIFALWMSLEQPVAKTTKQIPGTRMIYEALDLREPSHLQ